MFVHWGSFGKNNSLNQCHAVSAAALADDGLHIEDTAADGPHFLLGSAPDRICSVFLFPTSTTSTQVTVVAFSDDSVAAERTRNDVRQRIGENSSFLTSSTPWAVLLCKFNDNSTEPFPRSLYDDMFTTSGSGTNNMVDYFRDYSHRRIDTSGSRVFGWFTLPKKRSDYTGSGANPAGRDELVAWARRAASQAGIDLSPFFGVVVCMNVQTDLFGGSGRAVCDPGSTQPSVLGQEMGHGYWLDHSRTDGSTDNYTDRWDTMSTWDGCYMAPHPRYSLIGPGLNAANMASRGWLDEARVWNAPNPVDAELTLRPHVRYDLPGRLGARVGPYLVEFRMNESWDAAIPQPVVLIHRFQDNHSYIMAATSGRQGMLAGDVFEVGFGPVLGQPYYRVEVTGIDPTNQQATLKVSTRPGPHHFPATPAVPGTMPAGGQADGAVVIGGTAIPIPVTSPSFKILAQLASLHSAELTARGEAIPAQHTDALEVIRRLLPSSAGMDSHYSSPAPRSTEGTMRLRSTAPDQGEAVSS